MASSKSLPRRSSPGGSDERRRATTVKQYLAELPADRRTTVAAARSLVRKHLPKGYKEVMQWGMICWIVPSSKLAETYNGDPLCYAALAAQKNFNTLYLMTAYGSKDQYAWLRDEFKKVGKKFDMGKSCLHFKSIEDLVPSAVGKVLGSVTPDRYVEIYLESRRGLKTSGSGKKSKPKAES
jgi:Domain of unknown function (DU1801)